MKRILPITVALTVAGVCCVAAAYFCHFYYTLYQQTRTELQVSMDAQIESLRQEVSRLARQRHSEGEPKTAHDWAQVTPGCAFYSPRAPGAPGPEG